MFNLKRIGAYIKLLRKAKKYTQVQLAEELGVSHQAVSNWERGETMPDISMLPKLALLFDTTTDNILSADKDGFKGFDEILDHVNIIKKNAESNELIINNGKEASDMNNEIFNDENVIKDLKDKINEYNFKIEEFYEKKNELKNTLNDLNNKKAKPELSDSTKEKIQEVIFKVLEKIGEIDMEINNLNGKIKEINATLNPESEEDDGNGEPSEFDGELEKINDTLKGIVTETPAANIPPLNVHIPSAEIKTARVRGKYNVNFCQGAKIDSYCSQFNEKESAHMLIDDDPDLTTKWCATDRHITEITHPHWIIIDLREERRFNQLQIVKASEGSERRDRGQRKFDMSAWRCEVSNDKKHWAEFNRETNDKSSVYHKEFEVQTGRYVRLLIDAAESDPTQKHGHVRLYDLKLGMDNKNMCQGAVIDSCCGQNNDGEAAHKLIDNDRDCSTKWCCTNNHTEAGNVEPHWIIIDFEEDKTFNHLRIVKASEGHNDRGNRRLDMSAWRFEVSSDKEHWTEFNKETDDKSSIYVKTFAPQIGRYVRLLIDRGENDTKQRHAHVRLYDLRIDMVDERENSEEVTLDDIIAITPFAKKETLDKLVDKLLDIDDFGKTKQLAPFLSGEARDKLAAKALEKSDFHTIKVLAPFLSQRTLDDIVMSLDKDTEFEKIRSLASFLDKETLAYCVTGSSGKLDMKRLVSLASALGAEYIDEIISNMF